MKKYPWTILLPIVVVVVVVSMVHLASLSDMPPAGSEASATQPNNAADPPLRIGLVPSATSSPSASVFRRWPSICPVNSAVHLDTGHEHSTPRCLLHIYPDKQIDAAFLGSLVAVLSFDRLGAQPMVNPNCPAESSPTTASFSYPPPRLFTPSMTWPATRSPWSARPPGAICFRSLRSSSTAWTGVQTETGLGRHARRRDPGDDGRPYRRRRGQRFTSQRLRKGPSAAEGAAAGDQRPRAE